MVNHILIDGQSYMMEKIWRKNKKDTKKDSNGKSYPYPHEGKEWVGKKIFVDRMKAIEKILYAKNSYKTITEKNCLLCDAKSISRKMFMHNKIVWEDGLSHYIEKHLIEPSDSFKNMVYSYDIVRKSLNRTLALKGSYYGEFVKINKRQLNILDALMIHGGYNKKYTTNDEAKYSEHAGALDFEGLILTRIIVSGNMERIDDDDEDIYLPIDLSNLKEYEYIFHSHPPTPRPGGRADSEGILYEVPSIGDIYHFIEHHNTGNIIGSLVVAAEGLYCIRNLDINSTNISINDNALFKAYNATFEEIQDKSIDKYGTDFSTRKFYTKIAQDTQWIDRLNKTLNNFSIHIDYYPRKKDINNEWILDTVYLPFRKNKKKK